MLMLLPEVKSCDGGYKSVWWLVGSSRYLFLLFFQLNGYLLLAQIPGDIILTELNSDADNLVRDVFIKGTCKNVSNIEKSGAPESFGVFENGAHIIGFADGKRKDQMSR